MDLLTYYPYSGKFKWAKSHGFNRKGKAAGGWINGKPVVTVDGKAYPANRLAVLFMTGGYPRCKIGHKNGDVKDLRYANLYEV